MHGGGGDSNNYIHYNMSVNMQHILAMTLLAEMSVWIQKKRLNDIASF